jgi:hypothetical protein
MKRRRILLEVDLDDKLISLIVTGTSAGRIVIPVTPHQARTIAAKLAVFAREVDPAGDPHP